MLVEPENRYLRKRQVLLELLHLLPDRLAVPHSHRVDHAGINRVGHPLGGTLHLGGHRKPLITVVDRNHDNEHGEEHDSDGSDELHAQADIFH